jgi:hypothetical protein
MAFWREKSLQQMTKEEWESLCDGCGRCCLEKLEDMQTGEISYTNVACALLDAETCGCTNYAQRFRFMPDCIALDSKNIRELKWMPSTCAYRALAEGRDLAPWHPLVSGDKMSVVKAGISVKGRCIPAFERVGDLEDYIIDWAD